MPRITFRKREQTITKAREKGKPFPVSWHKSDPHTEMTYREYLKSPEWDFRSGVFIERAGGQCQQCGHPRGLHVHHKHYRTLGEEYYEDVEVLCNQCHKSRHKGWE